MMKNDCLIELGTEELPPKTLQTLSAQFAELMHQALEMADLYPAAVEVFATPRRLAVLFRDLPTRQPAQTVTRKGPALQAAFDTHGQPSKAALGFAKACGVTVDDLKQRETNQGVWLFFEKTEPGLCLTALLPDLLRQALSRLPIAKRMRWGTQKEGFVRPVKWLLIMVGDECVATRIFGVESGTSSYGHRFHAPGAIRIRSAGEYEQTLLLEGKVMAAFEQRKNRIRSLVEDSASQLGGVAQVADNLLTEVTALVEFPVAVIGEFDPVFLQIPTEALVMTMQDNQKYFAVFDQHKCLLPHFITIANIDSTQPEVVVRGNERVIRPRFADARFFFEQDQKQPLIDFAPGLEAVIFQEQLGSLADKVKRISLLATFVAGKIGADQRLVQRAAALCKCDLMSRMVGEFPRLQGIMGRYYAQHDHEDALVSAALEQHYWPRHGGDDLPDNHVAQCLALADRLDSLIGIFAVGQKPSGVKDPFALRRAALGVVRIIIERRLPLDLTELCQQGVQNLPPGMAATDTVTDVLHYIFDRLKAYYAEQQIGFDIVDAVIATRSTRLYDCHQRIQAVFCFQQNQAAPALAAANKRISNLLKKQSDSDWPSVNVSQLEATAERQLYTQLVAVQDQAQVLFDKGRYLHGLEQLATLRPAVDQFFDEVMVMVDILPIRHNRLALLRQLLLCFRQVADFSRIQT